ncbi:hypothetical protein [Actinospica robiniae]|uniref:hypothetical protein n=1 Tax=Actinospica robiniae TaxID=304901 RepID=UPI000414524C|nr:hypothetical protein [Actinospica robiniae]
MNRYVAPSFPLYEFASETPDDGAGRRWFVHWDGRVGDPAEDVLLAWESGPARALVCTTSRVFDRADARYRAVHLAIGGTFLPTAGRPAGPTQIARAMERLRDADDAWSPARGLVPDATAAEVTQDFGCSAAYTLFDGGAVFVVAVGVPLEHVRVRIARDSPTGL